MDQDHEVMTTIRSATLNTISVAQPRQFPNKSFNESKKTFQRNAIIIRLKVVFNKFHSSLFFIFML